MNKQREKIVFLDEGTVKYGGISLSSIEKLGCYQGYDKTTSQKISDRILDANHVIVNKCILDKKILRDHAGCLKSIHVTATGVNNIDLNAAREYGIAVTHVKGYSTESVVQFTIGFILALSYHLVEYQKVVADGEWQKSSFFNCARYSVADVAGKTLVILGYGSIGKRVAQVAKSLKMKVLICKIPGKKYFSQSISRVSLKEGLKKADFFSIHAPLSVLTNNLIDAKEIKQMKKTAYLINMARGGIINERAWSAALNSGEISGGATDVLSVEPPNSKNPLLKAKNLLITPHMAWASLESRERLIKEVALNIKAFQNNRVRNRVV